MKKLPLHEPSMGEKVLTASGDAIPFEVHPLKCRGLAAGWPSPHNTAQQITSYHIKLTGDKGPRVLNPPTDNIAMTTDNIAMSTDNIAMTTDNIAMSTDNIAMTTDNIAMSTDYRRRSDHREST